mmetsp:Transcript_72121/g.159578  ORF Transcript_72121/g.159578 Transcript_72121/m.159578 type:complete len:219 (-) Transcript_72121:322-978(-)
MRQKLLPSPGPRLGLNLRQGLHEFQGIDGIREKRKSLRDEGHRMRHLPTVVGSIMVEAVEHMVGDLCDVFQILEVTAHQFQPVELVHGATDGHHRQPGSLETIVLRGHVEIRHGPHSGAQCHGPQHDHTSYSELCGQRQRSIESHGATLGDTRQHYAPCAPAGRQVLGLFADELVQLLAHREQFLLVDVVLPLLAAPLRVIMKPSANSLPFHQALRCI